MSALWLSMGELRLGVSRIPVSPMVGVAQAILGFSTHRWLAQPGITDSVQCLLSQNVILDDLLCLSPVVPVQVVYAFRQYRIVEIPMPLSYI